MYVVSNWKMNLTAGEAKALLAGMIVNKVSGVRRVVLPPYPLLAMAREMLAKTEIALGGQDCHAESHGAYTGDVSAGMLVEAGCRYVLVGHSERRQHHNESNALVARKVAAACGAGLRVILCVGESDEVRQEGDEAAIAYVALQLIESLSGVVVTSKGLMVAYEPIWAIGTGKIPTPKQIETMHAGCRQALTADCPILYGGSVNADNIDEIARIPGVDGVLVGGASLKAEAINAIGEACAGVDSA